MLPDNHGAGGAPRTAGEGMTNSRKAAAAIIAAALVLIFADRGFFFFRDNFSTHYPMKVLSAQAFRSGQVPWWNLHDHGGQPLAANPNALTFYPDNILYLFLPAHVAFNLHFLLHFAAAFFAMRALCLARGATPRAATFGGIVWLLSGVVVSCGAFYNLVTAVALVPLALLAVERRSSRLLAVSFGLMLLAAEPVTLVGAALAVAIAGAGRMSVRAVATAAVLALVIGSPQITALTEISSEIERTVVMSPGAMLAASVEPKRLLELVLWPFGGFLNDPGGVRQRLFSTIFIGVIALPALWTRSRYVAIAVVCWLLAMGRFNPVVEALVTAFPSIRIMRYPEKFILPLSVALVVLIARYFDRTRFRTVWAVVTLAPLVYVAVRALPVDWFRYYVVPPGPEIRVHQPSTIHPGVAPARVEYRARAAAREYMFGAVGGLRYGVGRSPDHMHSLLTRLVADRFRVVPPELKARYLRIYGCQVPGALPMAMIVPATLPAENVTEAIIRMESPDFDERMTAVAPSALGAFRSAPAAVTSYVEKGQTIEIGVRASGVALLLVNQTYYDGWRARSGDRELDLVPLDVDRLGVLVPAGDHLVTLSFGRKRPLVLAAWAGSMLLLIVSAFPRRVEKLDGRTGEIERAADEDGPRI